MRVSVAIFLLSAYLAISAVVCAGEVIHLKNGRTIWADHVNQDENRVQYDVGEDSYSIPKSLVERIEAGGIPPEYSSATTAKAHDLPGFTPAVSVKEDPAVSDKILRDGQVDPEALSALEASNPSAAATAYSIAGKHEFDRGNFGPARVYFDRALRIDGQNVIALNYYASLLVRTGSPSEALSYAQRAVRISPDSPDALTVLGYAQYASDHTEDAIRTWKQALALRPDNTVQQYLAKAQRDATAEADYSQRESSHFSLHFEGRQTSDAFRTQLLSTLESEYDDLVRELGIAPRNTITVILYTEQQYFDVTQAPSWSGAVYDGKLRIPVRGIDSVNSDLARMLKHELTHCFINQLAAGRCPQWLNEGVAQAMEPKHVANGRLIANLFQTQQEIPLNALEGSFMRLNSAQAAVAYEESLAAVQYIGDTYGVSDLQRILQRLGEGDSAEAALRATIHSDYGSLQDEIGRYLSGKYGN